MFHHQQSSVAHRTGARQLHNFLESVLGSPPTFVSDRSWPDGKSSVLEVCDPDGVTWFVKRHHYRDDYRAELAAYQRWVPSLGERAPTLHAFDDELGALVVSTVPGALVDPCLDEAVHHEAAKLLRRFHAAETMG